MQPPKNQYNLSQKSPTRKSGFIRFQNKSSKKFFFHYNDHNGDPILFSQAYNSKSHRDKCLQSVKKNAASSSKYVQSKLEKYVFFTIKANNNRPIARSKNFKNLENLELAKAQLIEASTYNIDIESSKKYLKPPQQKMESTRENRSRYRFNLTFRKNTEEAPLLGTIEFPLTKEKDIFEGLDLEVIKNFIASHLPSEEKQEEPTPKPPSSKKRKGLNLEKSVELVEMGKSIPKCVFDNHTPIDINLQIKSEEAKPVLGKNYQASIIAKSLKAGISLQVCHHRGIIPQTGNIKFPVKMTNILDGAYRLIINIRINNSPLRMITADKIIQICSYP